MPVVLCGLCWVMYHMELMFSFQFTWLLSLCTCSTFGCQTGCQIVFRNSGKEGVRGTLLSPSLTVRQSSSPSCNPLQRLDRNRYHMMPFSSFLSPQMLWFRWSCCTSVLPIPAGAAGRQWKSSPKRKHNNMFTSSVGRGCKENTTSLQCWATEL